jgi:hypothetical protein
VNIQQIGLGHQPAAYTTLIGGNDHIFEPVREYFDGFRHALIKNKLVVFINIVLVLLLVDHTITVKEKGPAFIDLL